MGSGHGMDKILLVKHKVSACFFKNNYGTTSKDCSKSRIKFLFWLSFSLIGRFSRVYDTFMAGFWEQFSGSRAVYEQLLESQVAIRKLEYAT
jgi:hypothetical protein